LIDPTGAGDSFAGGLLGHLCENMNLESLGERSAVEIDRKVFVQAVKHGTAVASYTIESFSIERLQQITREDIQNRVAQIDLLMGHSG
jgi:sugar/nucleoside kinase (ribokinase family)